MNDLNVLEHSLLKATRIFFFSAFSSLLGTLELSFLGALCHGGLFLKKTLSSPGLLDDLHM